MFIAQNLHFDVLRLHEELLHKDVVVAEGLLGLSLHHVEVGADFLHSVAAAHTASAAACGCLYHYGVAYLGGYLARLLDGGYYAVGAGNDRDSRRYHRLLCGSLVAHRVHDLR